MNFENFCFLYICGRNGKEEEEVMWSCEAKNILPTLSNH